MKQTNSIECIPNYRKSVSEISEEKIIGTVRFRRGKKLNVSEFQSEVRRGMFKNNSSKYSFYSYCEDRSIPTC